MQIDDRFDIQAVLGRGGMGVVYAALDRVDHGRAVALKQLARENFDTQVALDRAVALFEREYHTLSQLTHPHIVEVYDYGVADSGPFYTMELLRGEPLRRQGTLAVESACSIARDVASALSLLHSRRLVHRDVTPLNIYRMQDGSAKLLDFGAMMPFGVAKQIVGTPAFIAPESLRLQALDGQADLYSLGLCLYYALTGRSPYKASNIAELRAAWLVVPAPLSQLAPDVPRALDELVGAMISLQPDARPRSAAEVFERLTSIARLPPVERSEVQRAYLTKPALAGRANEVALLRQRVLRAMHARGDAVLVSGASGTGKTRLLEAAMMEAQLCGAKVARGDASDMSLGQLGVARRVLGIMLEEQPELRARQSSLIQRWLGDAVESAGVLLMEQRQALLQAACQLVFEACAQHGWIVIVDDVHLLDEPSLAWLASLGRQARNHNLLLVTSIDPAAPNQADSAMMLLRASAKLVDVRELDAAASRELLSSLFGDVQNLELLHTLLDRVCRGSPRMLMSAAEHLLGQGLIRFEAGCWVISDDPVALESAIDRGDEILGLVGELSRDARELLELLALDRDSMMTLADYTALTHHGDASRMYAALDALISANIVQQLDDHARFLRADQQRGVAQNLDVARRQTLHYRLAERCRSCGRLPVYVAYHYFHAGEPARAVQPMREYAADIERGAADQLMRNSITLEVLEFGADLPEQPGVPAAFSAECGAGLIMNASMRGLPERMAGNLSQRLTALSKFSGLADYAELHALDEPARLTEALTRAAKRCEASGLQDFTIVSALRRTAQASLSAAVCAFYMNDPELLRSVPDLKPFTALSIAMALTARMIDAIAMLVRGQQFRAWDELKQVREELRVPAFQQLDSITRAALEGIVLGYLCGLEADHATATAPGLIDEYARHRPNSAESQRARYYLALGDLAAEKIARRRFEVLSVEAGALSDARVIELPRRLQLYALSDDVMGLRQTNLAIREVVRSRPRWNVRATLAHAHLLRCRGGADEALSLIERALPEADREQGDFLELITTHVQLLGVLGRFVEMRQVGQAALDEARSRSRPTYALELQLALAHAQLGDHIAAQALFERAEAALVARGCAGITLGRCYEVGARIALAAGDAPAFMARYACCAERYRAGKIPALGERVTALRRSASGSGMAPSGTFEPETTMVGDETQVTLLREALAQLVRADDFFQRALMLLVSHVGASAGALYTTNDEGSVTRVATSDELDAKESDEFAQRFIANEIQNDEATTASSEIVSPTNIERTLYTVSGRAFAPFLLQEQQAESDRAMLGVVLFAFAPGVRATVSQSFLDALAGALAEHTLALEQNDAEAGRTVVAVAPGSRLGRRNPGRQAP